MKLTKLMKGSALGALAAAMAITALPAEAVAQSRDRQERADRGDRGNRDGDARQQRRAARCDEDVARRDLASVGEMDGVRPVDRGARADDLDFGVAERLLVELDGWIQIRHGNPHVVNTVEHPWGV